MKYLALFKDAFRESVDNRVLHVLGFLSALFVLLCAGLTFERKEQREVLMAALKHVLAPHREGGHGAHRAIEYEVPDLKPLGGGDGFTFRFVLPAKAHYSAELEDYQQGPARFILTAYEWNRSHRGAKAAGEIPETIRAVPIAPDRWEIQGGIGRPTGGRDIDASERAYWRDHTPAVLATLDTALGVEFISARLRQSGFRQSRVALLPTGDGSLAFDVTASFAQTGELRDVTGMALFGVPIFSDLLKGNPVSAADLVLIIETILSKPVAGWFGIGVSIVITSWMFPRMMTDGSLALLVTKPLSRVALFAAKFLAGGTFAFLNAALLIGGTWLALSWRAGWWNGWYLLNIPLLVLVFLVVHSVSAFIGTWTRSTIPALMAALAAWFLMGTMSLLVQYIHENPAQFSKRIRTTADVAHAVVPKAGEIMDLSEAFVLRARGSLEDLGRQERAWLDHVDPVRLLVPSVLFASLWVGLGIVIFVRRDV